MDKHENLTVRQVAEILDCHIHTVYRYVESGKLKARKLGGNTHNRLHWIIDNHDLDKFLRGEK
jgi:excisionase family DNA binding protein